ncbi:hypothetical protein K431DRAFT_300238 [Polychaeton citri CBS 116435]|uniref:Uncharacterized protein n=1 Tax=Polychaeton citri CBS 116435 TaxID=1314669 RepID=A0A9P4UR91_9PEZI|nr:hypothetical protein K431DRAFT_300238 [Polychaeton citri CBS 116435]
MAEDFENENDFVDFDDDIWMYVDDAVEDLADELVENTIPSPGYTGVNEELALGTSEYDVYDYFADLEYGEDLYWDYDGSEKKRKRALGEEDEEAIKRRRLKSEGSSLHPVVFVSRRERNAFTEPPMLDTQGTFALLPNWREKLDTESRMVIGASDMPADMKRAANAASVPEDKDADQEEDWEDDCEEEDDEDGEMEAQDESPLADLDPNALKTILQQRLAEAGISGGENEAAFMDTIQQMLSGGSSGGEDPSDMLARMLLGKATEEDEEDGAVSGWLSGQGVRFDEDDGEATEEASTFDSPMDSGIALPQDSEDKMANGNMALEPTDTASSNLRSRKRKAEDGAAANTGPVKKTRGQGRGG